MAGKISLRLLAAGLSCALVSLNIEAAWAAGFSIREQSSTAQGNAFAGATAGAEDISYMFFNPAGPTHHDESQVQAVASYIRPYSRAKGANATTLFGNQIEGNSNSKDVGEDALLPAFYAMWAAEQDLIPGLRLGLGINLPFGLINDNDEDWNDSVFVAPGVTDRPETVKGLSLRLGLAYDESPIPTRTRTPRVPGEDRYWVSVGAGYKLNDWTEFTLSYTHIFMKDGDVELSTDDDPNNTFRGNLDASYDQHIDIVTFSGRIVF